MSTRSLFHIPFILFLAFSVVHCAPARPVSSPSCVPCKGMTCPTGFWCAHGYCLSKGKVRCSLPLSVTITISSLHKVRSVNGCEENEKESCFPTDRPCHEGQTSCVNGYWSACKKAKAPDKLGRFCSLGQGSCLQEGRWLCVRSGKTATLFCHAKIQAPTEERCNGKDDDCDGTIDETLEEDCFGGPFGAKGIGLCKIGRTICQNGRWSPCKGQVLPNKEKCNGKDDDCDGLVDEKLTRSCYQGPDGSDGIGPCKAGVQRCESGSWAVCKGEVFPKQGQSCLPVLKHSIPTSLLECRASAQSQECVPSGSCKTFGSQKEGKERSNVKDLFVRCRSNHSATCGAYTSEGVSRREIAALKEKNGGLRLSISGFAGSCSCNSWCQNGCGGQSGCCLTCGVTERHCYASASYLAYHKFEWKDPLPSTYPLLLEVEVLKGGTPVFSVQKKTGSESFQLKSKQVCSIVLSNEPITILLINQVSLLCGGAQNYELVFTIRPIAAGQMLPKPCFTP